MARPLGDGKLFLLIGASALFATGVALLARSWRHAPVPEAPDEKQAQAQAQAPAAAPTKPREKAAPWARFQQAHGPGLKPIFLPSGRLVSVTLEPGATVPVRAVRTGFDPSDPGAAIARAREIMADAGPMLGVVPESPLGEPVARGGALGAQVFFQQRFGEALVAPAGQVTVELSASGELSALYSDYVAGLSVANPVRIGADQAREAATEAVREPGSSVLPRGGAPVVWVSRPASRSGKVEGRNAYQFLVHGRQVIVDASTGEILYRRDVRRQ